MIPYYEQDVDPIAEVLREALLIDDQRSPDKRVELNLREFGYRSVHLLARIELTGLEAPAVQMLGSEWFEIQIRSILEHAWAEIEHELVYKAGIGHGEDFRRQFSRLAGTLEVSDRSFRGFARGTPPVSSKRSRSAYGGGQDADEPLDVARLLGLLENERPAGHGFRAKPIRRLAVSSPA